ncbi:hypothetical protein L3V83_00655 [Thiotrichales bacterium 19X7-9]|nr:hypothetical protein [Thiotrichales bacterium 19X7-9]
MKFIKNTVISLALLSSSFTAGYSYDEAIHEGDHWQLGSTQFKLHITADPIDSCIFNKLNSLNLIVKQSPPWTQNYFYYSDTTPVVQGSQYLYVKEEYLNQAEDLLLTYRYSCMQQWIASEKILSI